MSSQYVAILGILLLTSNFVILCIPMRPLPWLLPAPKVELSKEYKVEAIVAKFLCFYSLGMHCTCPSLQVLAMFELE